MQTGTVVRAISDRGSETLREMNVLSREAATAGADAYAPRVRILILGGGFGGVYIARHLEKLCRRRPDVEIVLVSRDNFLVMTPLLFDWTFAFLFRPDIVKISLDSETVSLVREAAAGAVPADAQTEANFSSDWPSPAGVTALRAGVRGR